MPVIHCIYKRHLLLLSFSESQHYRRSRLSVSERTQPSITRFARLIPLPRAARCKSPPGCLLIAHEVWRLSPFSSGKSCELRDFACGENLYVLMQDFPPPKVKRLRLSMPIDSVPHIHAVIHQIVQSNLPSYITNPSSWKRIFL